MVYRMKIYVDGGCRNNGKPNAIGSCAAVIKYVRPRNYTRTITQLLPSYPCPTNQRAELSALILALETARARYSKLRSDPKFLVKIYSDSTYAVKCMNEWWDRWSQNGWKNAKKGELVNKDLILRVRELEGMLEDDCRGRVEFIWVPRDENELADAACNRVMDEEESKRDGYVSSSDEDSGVFY